VHAPLQESATEAFQLSDHDAEVTLITKSSGSLSKRIELDENEVPISTSPDAWVSRGTMQRAPAPDAASLADMIAECGDNQAIALGRITGTIGPIVDFGTKRNPVASGVSRTREWLDYHAGIPAWLLTDTDKKGMPEAVQAALRASGGVWAAILSFAPELAAAARVSRASTSAGLYHGLTGRTYPGSGGEHHYVLIADGADIRRTLEALHELAWLHGFGWFILGKGGALLERSIIDRLVWGGERLCFEAPPTVIEPLEQDDRRHTRPATS
jgi:hypothetical protein